MFNKNINNKIVEAIVPIAIISLILLAIIFLIRIIFYLLIFIFSLFYKPQKNKIKKITPKTDIVIYNKEDEELYRNYKKEKKVEKEQMELQNVERMNEDDEKNLNTQDIDNDYKVVGVVKPIGFWTSLILGDQLSQILGRAQALNNKSHKGFWVSMLEAQAHGLGRQHGKQRSL